ncbi:MAG: ubiquinone-binding protein [Alphaproteobacteria bacterium]|jgi:coenzyme Q-binding protein COQ10|nr:ubiquinone-binding protein [Rickettsiaceae bacterium]NBY34685.1 ubiquinone-binding protein [Alphaproteobacteria bacterium]UCM94389.1 MAG: ubiquinone-binding protein [Candidatus Megaira endosymbiont of Mesostigma viride]NDA91210.1 ubiquinone-binding protein [Alphaproteobacteria bacterium]NDE19319.1 ubiquinone-binding protein [Alphaproteobacteria bacterium]
MPSFSDTRLLPYEAKLVRDIILDIGKYPEFLPWCSDAELLSNTEKELIAQLTISYKFFRETYKSLIVTTETPEGFIINVEAISGPFKKLTNFWSIRKINNQCEVKFSIDFEFKSVILDAVIGTFFSMATNKMIKAFETRAYHISRNGVL